MARLAAIRRDDVVDEREDLLDEVLRSPDVARSPQELPRRGHTPEAHVLSRRGRRRTSSGVPTVLVRDALFGILVGVVLIGGITLGLKLPELVEQLLQWFTS